MTVCLIYRWPLRHSTSLRHSLKWQLARRAIPGLPGFRQWGIGVFLSVVWASLSRARRVPDLRLDAARKRETGQGVTAEDTEAFEPTHRHEMRPQ